MQERLGSSIRRGPFLGSANWRQPVNIFIQYKTSCSCEDTELPELFPWKGNCRNDKDRFVSLVGELRVEKVVRQKQIKVQNFYLDKWILGSFSTLGKLIDLVPLRVYKMNGASCFQGKFIGSIIHICFWEDLLNLFRSFIDVSKLLVKMKYILEATWLILRCIMDAASVPNLE